VEFGPGITEQVSLQQPKNKAVSLDGLESAF
jgi:hypothetical protein